MHVSHIGRYTDFTEPVTFTDDAATTGRFPMGPTAGGMLLCTGTSTNGALKLTFQVLYARDDASGFTLADDSDAVIEMDVQPNRAYPLPDGLFAARFVRAVTASGTVSGRILLKG
jgi:hypothetical protein